MKRLNLTRYRTLNIGLLRLFIFGLVLYLYQSLILGPVLAVIAAMFFPFVLSGKSIRLATGTDVEEAEKALLEKVTAKTKEVMEKATEGLISEKKLEKALADLNKEIAKLSNEATAEFKKTVDGLIESQVKYEKSLKEAQDALLAQSTEIKKLTDKAKGISDETPKTWKEAFKQALVESGIFKMVKDNDGERMSALEYFEKNGQRSVSPKMTIKVATDMFESNIVQANVATLRLTELDPNRVGIPLSIYPHVIEVFQVKGIRRPSMALLVVYDYQDGAGTKVEGAAGVKSSFLLKTVSFPAFYDTTYFSLSDETLDDLDEVLDEISKTAPDKLRDNQDLKILGTAGDDVAAIKGIRTAAKSTAYATVLGADSIEGAYIVDVVEDAKLQAEANKYKPNAVIISTTDVAKLAAKKNTFEDSQHDNRVVYGPTGEATFVCGLRVIKQSVVNMPANQLLVLDNSQPWIGERRTMTMEIGYNGTDLIEGQKTVVLKQRYAFGVRDPLAIIWVSDIAAAIAGLQP